MIYFTDWWSYGENCILQTFNGVLAGDHKMNDMCIYEDGSLKLFRDSIAKELVIDSGERLIPVNALLIFFLPSSEGILPPGEALYPFL